MVRQITQVGLCVVILVMALYTHTARAHGKVAMEEDSCMRRIGENMIHLSTYQPQVDEEGHYCTDIPKAGNAILVIDLVDPSLRELDPGKYLILITAEGVPPLNYEYHLRVEMINYAEVFRAWIGPVVGLLLATILGYKLFRSRRFREWMDSRESKKH